MLGLLVYYDFFLVPSLLKVALIISILYIWQIDAISLTCVLYLQMEASILLYISILFLYEALLVLFKLFCVWLYISISIYIRFYSKTYSIFYFLSLFRCVSRANQFYSHKLYWITIRTLISIRKIIITVYLLNSYNDAARGYKPIWMLYLRLRCR